MELAVGTLVGILIGAYCATPLKGLLAWLDEQYRGITGYIWLGAILAYMSAAMQWLGFAVVVVTFLLFHIIKGGGIKALTATRRKRYVGDPEAESESASASGRAA